jgi:HD-GYP domain-containing protein (c-di-GMP phosphodiesterase class II)
MSSQELKTSIEGLSVGMYVTRLDRPWLETPFPFQGLRIDSLKDIELLRRYASYVYIDTEKGPTPPPEFWITGGHEKLELQGAEPPPVEAFKNSSENEYTKLRKCFYEIKTTFEQEFADARDIKAKIDDRLKKMLTDLQKGKVLDIAAVKEGVEAAVSSILRNPSAFALLVQMEKSNEYTYSHSLGTSVWCAQFGRHLGLERHEIQELALGGMLLDIGKVKLPNEILNKKDVLTPEECDVIRMHVDYSLKILAQTQAIPHVVLRMVATHHERADGDGYPEGLTIEAIPIYGRIAGIVDSYDAMTTKRPHSDEYFTPHEAINELYLCRQSVFQEELVEQFIQTVGLYPTGSLVEFASGEVGVVIEVNDLKRLFPTVMIVLDKEKLPLDEFVTVNLSKREQTDLKVEKALPHGAYGIKMEQLFL